MVCDQRVRAGLARCPAKVAELELSQVANHVGC
jgi:hypothetical protein